MSCVGGGAGDPHSFPNQGSYERNFTNQGMIGREPRRGVGFVIPEIRGDRRTPVHAVGEQHIVDWDEPRRVKHVIEPATHLSLDRMDLFPGRAFELDVGIVWIRDLCPRQGDARRGADWLPVVHDVAQDRCHHRVAPIERAQLRQSAADDVDLLLAAGVGERVEVAADHDLGTPARLPDVVVQCVRLEHALGFPQAKVHVVDDQRARRWNLANGQLRGIRHGLGLGVRHRRWPELRDQCDSPESIPEAAVGPEWEHVTPAEPQRARRAGPPALVPHGYETQRHLRRIGPRGVHVVPGDDRRVGHQEAHGVVAELLETHEVGVGPDDHRGHRIPARCPGEGASEGAGIEVGVAIQDREFVLYVARRRCGGGFLVFRIRVCHRS